MRRHDDRQHRHARIAVVLIFGSRQTPEVWRRPQEKDKPHQGWDNLRHRSYRGGAGEHGEAAGQPSDDDVPSAAALQPYGVDNAIGEGAEKDENASDGPTRRSSERQRSD